ncbi:hypothetical protein FNU76_02225 [Chitinimonas arctica]|uniref:Uncharacterized protein n=1 Tax=Chitinimonas arctica TaxID=2594795 RepID=A0A516SAU0_9NEIS|nr:hypothetical protein [Chitinimonas arctica]QDQ25261.1 hypothetical protein FNU76_02225 [Chitinimonas arctica]
MKAAQLFPDIRAIMTFAAGKYDDEMVGYYVWAQLGYDASLTESEQLQWRRDSGSNNAVTTIQALLEQPDGLAWWRLNGYGRIMQFDLSPGSPSIKVLNAYLAKEGIRV